MGVDTVLRLPSNVRVRDVAEVMAALLGNVPKKRYLGKDSYAAKVEGYEILPSHTAEMCIIRVDAEDANGPIGPAFLSPSYHFEGTEGLRTMTGRSGALTIAVFCAVADFFGGSVDFEDCDDSYQDHEVKAKSNAKNCPDDGKPWQDQQDRILTLKPLTPHQIQKYNEFAAYQNEGDRGQA